MPGILAAVHLAANARNQHQNEQSQGHKQPDPACIEPKLRGHPVHHYPGRNRYHQVDDMALGMEPGILVMPIRIFDGRRANGYQADH